MAILYVTEYTDVMRTDRTATPAALEPATTDQTVDFTAGVAASAAFDLTTRLVRIHTDADCHVVVAVAPTATTSNRKMIAGQTEYFAVARPSTGDTAMKVSAISA
jgi:hypothetical protein